MKIKHWNERRTINVRMRSGRFSSLKSRIRVFFHKLTVSSLVLTIVACSYFITFTVGQITAPRDGVYGVETAHAATKATMIPPVMKRIAQAESHNSHYCTQTLVVAKMCKSGALGQVLTHANKNGTTDVGRYQINADTWGAKATEMKLDLYDESDNEAMALYIYANFGTEPWYSSDANW